MTDALSRGVFATRGQTVVRFLDVVARFMPAEQSFRVLDVGCGTGGLALALGERWTKASVLGVDLSSENIAEARLCRERMGLTARVDFRCADVLQTDIGRFDLIVCDSVLHLIPQAQAVIATRLSDLLQPEGLLLATLPDASWGNAVRLKARQLWSLLPAGADEWALRVARRLYPDTSEAALRGRIPYLRMTRYNRYDVHYAGALTQAGLAEVVVQRWRSDSIAKPRHVMIVYKKAARFEARSR